MSSKTFQESKYLPSKYDRQFYLTKGEKSQRFDELKPLVVHVLYSERKSFEYVRDVALARLEKTILDQLDLLALGDIYDYSHLEELSKNIFRWGKKDFLKRRKLKKTIWIKILKRESNKRLLDGLKIFTDLREIKTFVKIIFNVLRDAKQIDLGAVENLIWRPIEEVEHYLNILETLDDENLRFTEIYKDLKFKFNSRLFNSHQSDRQRFMRQRETDLLNSQATEPIVIRYIVNWYRGIADQVQLKKFLKQKVIENKIYKEDIRMSLNEMCDNSIRDFLYAQTEQFKAQIIALQRRYDNEVEAIENNINYTRIQMKKLQDHKQFLTDEVARFREEIRVVLEEEERIRLEAEEQERLRLEQEAFLENERLRLEKLKAKKEKRAKKLAARKGR